jgi:ketosteroid isomerase-like protein
LPASESLESVVRGLVELFNRRDWDAFADRVHPRFEFHSVIMSMIRGPDSSERVYRGFDGLKGWAADVDDAFEAVMLDTLEIEAVGPAGVFELARFRARGRGSGAPVTLDFVRVWEFEGRQVRRIRAYKDVDEGRSAAAELENAPRQVPGS